MHTKPSHSAGIAAIVAVGYWIVGVLCRALASADTQSAPVWLGAGLIFGALLVTPTGYRAGVLVGALVASYAWGLLGHGLDAAAALPFALIEVLCSAAGAWVARRSGANAVSDLADVSWLIAGALLAAALGASLAGEFWRWQRLDVVYSAEWRAWAFSTLVGILLAAPVITAFRGFRVKRSGGMPMAQFVAGAGAFAVFFAAASVIFGADVQQRFGTVAATLGYLPMPFLLLAALVWGARGGALAMLAGALLVIGKTSIGGGPFAVADGFVGEAVIEVQAYVAIWAMLILLARGLSESRRDAKAQARNWQLRYERILEANRTVSVEFDAVNGRALWDERAAAVLGGEVFSLENVSDWHARIDTPQRGPAQAVWNALAQGERSSDSDIYTVHLDGPRAVQVQLAAVHGPNGAVERIVGLLRPLEAVACGGQHG